MAATRSSAHALMNAGTVAAPDLGPDADWTPGLHAVDCVVHCAGVAHQSGKQLSLDDFRWANTLGSIRLAEQAARSGVRRFVFLSSVGVHGSFTGQPFRESDHTIPEEAYAISKHEAELALLDLTSRTGMEVVIIRPPLVHGPAAPGNFGRLMHLAQSSIPLPFGCVRNRRSILSVHNLASLIERCIFHPKAANEIFLASDDHEISTADMIRILRTAQDKPARVWPFPPSLLVLGATVLGQRRLYEKMLGDLIVDASKAKALLNWSPPFTIEEGLTSAVRGSAPHIAQARENASLPLIDKE